MPTLRDLGKSLNLSAMAVSKALRDAPDISATTRARVQAEAKRRGYVPNQAARLLRSKASGLLGLLVPNLRESRAARIAAELESAAHGQGLELLLAQSQGQVEEELGRVDELAARRIEGLVLLPAVRWQNRLATLERLAAHKIPTVLVEHYPAGAERFPGCSWIVYQEAQAAALAVEHLAGLGHKKILLLAGPHGSWASAARHEGYRKALEAAGLEYDEGRVFLAGMTLEDGRSAMLRAIDEGVKFSAIMAFTDSVALGAIEVLRGQGRRVPEEVSVVGFGDNPTGPHAAAPLTTVRADRAETARRALTLLRRLREGKPAAPIELPVDLLVRRSTARAGGG